MLLVTERLARRDARPFGTLATVMGLPFPVRVRNAAARSRYFAKFAASWATLETDWGLSFQ